MDAFRPTLFFIVYREFSFRFFVATSEKQTSQMLSKPSHLAGGSLLRGIGDSVLFPQGTELHTMGLAKGNVLGDANRTPPIGTLERWDFPQGLKQC